jgi:hypothetical protein
LPVKTSGEIEIWSKNKSGDLNYLVLFGFGLEIICFSLPKSQISKTLSEHTLAVGPVQIGRRLYRAHDAGSPR